MTKPSVANTAVTSDDLESVSVVLVRAHFPAAIMAMKPRYAVISLGATEADSGSTKARAVLRRVERCGIGPPLAERRV